MKPAIPVLRTNDAALDSYAGRVKETLDSMTGQLRNGAKIKPLGATATLPDVIAKVNEIIKRLQE